MSNISDFRAYWHRKYRLGGDLIDEGEVELSQLPAYVNGNNGNIPETALYQGYASNFLPNFTQVYLYDFLGQNQYAGYGPGSIYLSKKYYTIDDILPKEWFNNYQGLIDIYDHFVETIKTDKRIGRHFYYPCHANPLVRFIDYENEFFVMFYMFMNTVYDVTYNDITHQYTTRLPNSTTDIYINAIALTYEVPISQMFWGGNDERNTPDWYCNTPDGVVNLSRGSKYSYGANWWRIEVELGNSLSEDIVTALPNHRILFLRFLQNLDKIKFYPITRNTTDTRYMSNFNGLTVDSWTISRAQTTLGSVPMLCDISDCPNFPQNGFFELFNNLPNVISNRITRLDRNAGGPPSNNPDNREDDPNDEDKKPNPDDKGGDGDHDDTDDKIPKPGLPTLSAAQAGLITIFNPSVSELSEISGKLWSPDAWESIKQYFTTPLDAVLGLGIIPVAPVTSGRSNVLLGLYDTEVSANVVGSDYVIVDCGSIPITRYYGSYLDYSPYTHIKCYLPYIGEIDISPDEAMQKTLNIQYYVNVVTGDTVAMCLLNGDLFYTATGNCVRQLPLSSADYSAIINTAVNAVSTIMTAAATADVGAAAVEAASARPKVTEESKKLASAQATANNVGSSTSLLNNITGAKMRYNHAGSMGTGAGQLCRQKPYLIIERPNLDLASNYKGFVGYPCNKTKQISLCKGYTQIEASNIAVANATDVEVSMIKEILMEGVIL